MHFSGRKAFRKLSLIISSSMVSHGGGGGDGVALKPNICPEALRHVALGINALEFDISCI